jgi:hypothetical protein
MVMVPCCGQEEKEKGWNSTELTAGMRTKAYWPGLYFMVELSKVRQMMFPGREVAEAVMVLLVMKERRMRSTTQRAPEKENHMAEWCTCPHQDVEQVVAQPEDGGGGSEEVPVVPGALIRGQSERHGHEDQDQDAEDLDEGAAADDWDTGLDAGHRARDHAHAPVAPGGELAREGVVEHGIPCTVF